MERAEKGGYTPLYGPICGLYEYAGVARSRDGVPRVQPGLTNICQDAPMNWMRPITSVTRPVNSWTWTLLAKTNRWHRDRRDEGRCAAPVHVPCRMPSSAFLLSLGQILAMA